MPGRKRLLWVALATGMMVAPSTKAKARTRAAASVEPPRAPAKQGRRLALRSGRAQALPPSASPCGRHEVRVERGTVLVDGRAVHPGDGGAVYLLAAPAWRRDGNALAWVERNDGETRLVVLPDLKPGTAPLVWSLPAWPGGDRVAWAGAQRVVVGPELLAPRAVASWTE
jgi:hypothetical protein